MTFEGIKYRTSELWNRFIPIALFRDRPIRYLELGIFYGANVLSVASLYAQHPESEIHCVDPWIDYKEYDEYVHQQSDIYRTFLKNLVMSPHASKFHIHRTFSHRALPQFPDESFDIIYIDGNHRPQSVLEDAVLAFRRLKIGGYLIFDDYGWAGLQKYRDCVDAFTRTYADSITILGEQQTQLFIQKRAS